MLYSQILNGIIANIIELDDSTIAPLFAQDYDSCLQIDNLSPIPQIGWYYDTPSSAFYPPAVLALIQNNLVTSVIQNCAAYIVNNSSNYQYIIDITASNPQPQIGWSYSGTTFSPSVAYYQSVVAAAIAFGAQLILQYTAQNVAAGVTQAGKTNAVIAYTSTLFLYLQSGSLYSAIGEIATMIADVSSTKIALSPFVTNNILYLYLNQIQTYLGLPLTANPGS